MQIVPIPGGAGSPFRLNSLPQNAFAHASWECAGLQALVLVGRGERLLLLGRPGAGKSLLLRSLDQTLRARGVSVRQFRSGDPIVDLTDEDVLLIDEAGHLSTAEFEQILRLSNAFVMAGLPSLPERLSFCPDAFRSVTLEPLTPEDVARFVVARLVATDRSRAMFTPEALVALASQSSGLLRLVIILAGAAMFFAEQRGAAKVTAEDIAEAVSMRSDLQPEEAEQPTASHQQIACTKSLCESAMPEVPERRRAWLGPIASRTWQWERAAGLTAWAFASLAVIAAASMAALGIKPVPSLVIQEVVGRSAPNMASFAVPDMALSPAIQPDAPVPVQLVTQFPPVLVGQLLAPALAPTSPLETARLDVAISRAADTGSIAATPLPPDPLPPPTLPDPAQSPPTVLAFAGPILNDTMQQNGQLSLQLRIRGAHGPVAAVFHASKGLIGSGVLTGDVGSDGRMILSGRLMMGNNQFDCALHATLKGERLVGAATFIRSTSGAAAHSSFSLSRL